MFSHPKRLYVHIVLALFFFLLFLVLGFFSLDIYNVNWDEPKHFNRGHAILNYFLSGKKDYSNLTETLVRRSFYQNEALPYSFFENYFEKHGRSVIGHPAASNVLGAIFNTIFYQKLHVLGDVESFHFLTVLLASALVAGVYLFLASEYGVFAAIIGSVSLLLYPLFLGESRYNIKDIPQAVFLSFCLFSLYRGIIHNSMRWIFISSLFFGFALGTKLNILFLPFIVLPWYVLYTVQNRKKKTRDITKQFPFLIFYPIAGGTIFLATWPMLWTDTFNRVSSVIAYYKEIGTDPTFEQLSSTIFGFHFYAAEWILYTTPLIILLLSFVGLLYVVKNGLKEKNKTSLFIFLWILIPVLRVTLPSAGIYGGVRQIMEYIPAMAMLSGIGAGYMVTWLHGYMVKKKLFNQLTIQPLRLLQLFVILLFLPITLKLISIHPNESVYFNPLIGGLKGAKERNLPGWGNSLGSTYRQGIRWINEHAEKNAKVVLVYELASNIYPKDFRPDITFFNQNRSGLMREGEYAIGLVHFGTHEEMYYRKYLERFVNPVYEVSVDGVALLKVWKNDKDHTKTEYLKPEKTTRDAQALIKDKNLILDIGNEYTLTKLMVKYDSRNCAIPQKGYFEISKDNRKWERIGGDFTNFYFAQRFTIQPQIGTIQILLADKARYIQMVINESNSCLTAHPITSEVSYLD